MRGIYQQSVTKSSLAYTGELNKIIQIAFLYFSNLDNMLLTLLRTYRSIAVTANPCSFLRISFLQTYNENPFQYYSLQFLLDTFTKYYHTVQ